MFEAPDHHRGPEASTGDAVRKPPPASRLSLRQAYDQLVPDAEYADATLKVHQAAWRYIEGILQTFRWGGSLQPRSRTR